jgi:hypothetical protein
MSETSIAKRPATFMREQTQQVRDHISAATRATERYFAALARAKAGYFEDMRRITEAVTTEAEPESAPASEGDGAAPPIA